MAIENNTDVVLSDRCSRGVFTRLSTESADPPLAGLGLAAIRDFISYLKHNAEGIRSKYAIGFGTSQSAMVLKALIYEGFNADEKGRQVFDGIFSNVAGGRRATFHRFTHPRVRRVHFGTRPFQRQISFPTQIQPRQTRYPELVMAYWFARRNHARFRRSFTRTLRMSTGDPRALCFTPQSMENTTSRCRLHLESICSREANMVPLRSRQSGGRGQNLPNFNDYRWVHRALLDRLRSWVIEGKEPPRSLHPTLSTKTLVRIDQYRFPAIPNVLLPSSPHLSERLDFGPSYRNAGVIHYEPPRLGKLFAALVPQADSDGIDIAGVKMPWISVPLGTFTGWNLRNEAIGARPSCRARRVRISHFRKRRQSESSDAIRARSIEER